MLPEYRYFKCNMLGGFRLSDINLTVKQEQYFHVDSHVAETSRAVQSALKAKWMVEVDADEASKHIEVTQIKKTRADEAKPAVSGVSKVGTAIPNIREVNKNLESRQAARQKEQDEEKVAVPNMSEAEKKIDARNKELLSGNKTDNKLIDEIVASPAKAAKMSDDTEFETIDPTAVKAEADEEGVTTIKSLSKDEEESVSDDLNARIRRRRKESE